MSTYTCFTSFNIVYVQWYHLTNHILFLDSLMMEFRTLFLLREWETLQEDLWGKPPQTHQLLHPTIHPIWEDHGYLEIKCIHPYSVHPPLAVEAEDAVLEVVVEQTIPLQSNHILLPQHHHLSPLRAPILTSVTFNNTNNSSNSII